MQKLIHFERTVVILANVNYFDAISRNSLVEKLCLWLILFLFFLSIPLALDKVFVLNKILPARCGGALQTLLDYFDLLGVIWELFRIIVIKCNLLPTSSFRCLWINYCCSSRLKFSNSANYCWLLFHTKRPDEFEQEKPTDELRCKSFECNFQNR